MNAQEKQQYDVFILEDDPMIQQNLKERVQRLGYSVCSTVDSYKAAIKAAEKSLPKVAICDIKIRGFQTGVDVAKKLKTMGEVAIIYLTAHTDSETLKEAGESDFEVYMPKAGLTDELLDAQIQAAIKNLEKKAPKEYYIQQGVLTLKSEGFYHRVNIQDIWFVNVHDNTCTVFTQKKMYPTRQKLSAIAQDLVKYGILQINRSQLINIQKVALFKSLDCIELDFSELTYSLPFSPKCFSTSEKYRDAVKHALGIA